MPPRLTRTNQGRRHNDKQKKDDQAIPIGENLFMGSIQGAENGDNLKKCGVTHILSVLSSDCLKKDDRFEIKTVLIDDVRQADLISVLPECVAFIDDAIRNNSGKVFVHCMSGVSRSAAVAIAYKMQHEKKTFDEAHQELKTARPDVDPNDGFIEQLHTFEKMGFALDGDLPEHAQYRASHARERVASSPNAVEGMDLGIDPDQENAAKNLTHVYQCRGCARRLFSRRNVVPHTRARDDNDNDAAPAATHSTSSTSHASAATSSKTKKKKKKKESRAGTAVKSKSDRCETLYIEPMSWMQIKDLIAQEEGKIGCPKCYARIGAWSWRGMECHTCKQMVTPCFRITRSRVERRAVDKK